ncbi:MAG: glycosyltransferase family 2 protein [Firmicutes bacterium]|nr:glycosyltransferase family 2 protein [Bacillota bacterium]
MLKENHGKGFALRKGIETASGGIIIFQDADLEYDPDDFHIMIAPILEGRAKAVTGSRFPGKAVNMSLFYYIGNGFLSFANNILFGAHINDLCSCYKAFETETLRSLNLDCVGFESEADMISRAERKGIKIIEVLIRYNARTSEQGKKLKWFDGVLIFLRLLRNRFIKIK